jgi:hypothetical protein
MTDLPVAKTETQYTDRPGLAADPVLVKKPAEILPQEGGSYTRNADGTLTRTLHPTILPETTAEDAVQG